MLNELKRKLEDAADAVENAQTDLRRALETALRSAASAVDTFSGDLEDRLTRMDERFDGIETELHALDEPDEPDDFTTHDPPHDPPDESPPEGALDSDLAELMDALSNDEDT